MRDCIVFCTAILKLELVNQLPVSLITLRPIRRVVFGRGMRGERTCPPLLQPPLPLRMHQTAPYIKSKNPLRGEVDPLTSFNHKYHPAYTMNVSKQHIMAFITNVGLTNI